MTLAAEADQSSTADSSAGSAKSVVFVGLVRGAHGEKEAGRFKAEVAAVDAGGGDAGDFVACGWVRQ